MDDLRERVDAVERALTDGDGDLTALADGAATAERVEQLEDDLADVRSDLRELQAATQALRGYVGNVRSVNDRVEQRAETALSEVERLESGHHAGPDRTGRRGRVPAQEDEQHRTCQACGQSTADENDGRPSAATRSSTADRRSYDRPGLDGFDPDPDPDVPDPTAETGGRQANGEGDQTLDGTVLSRIRDLV